jgi:hypothetical protein
MPDTNLIFYPPTKSRADAIAAGFRFGHIGTHTSRTIMLDELGATFEALPPEAKPAEYAAAIIDANCLGKRTVATRRLSFQRLRELYALDAAVPMFRILRRLWETDAPGRPLIALLSSLARDPLLMATAETVVGLADGEEYQRPAMRGAVEKAVGERMNESTIDKVVRNAASSWSQSGHLVGRTFKFRRTVRPTPAVVAFALYLAHAAGFQGEYMLSTGWLKVLDCGASSALELATAAKRMGLLDLRMAGDVFDLSLDRLDPLFRESQGRV